jgi:hypothetical protein
VELDRPSLPGDYSHWQDDEHSRDISPTIWQNPVTVFKHYFLLNWRNSTGAPFSTIKATVTPGEGELGAISISFSGDFSGEIVDFEGDMWNRTDKFRDERFRFETHPLDSEGARFISRHERRMARDQAFTFSTLGRGNSEVMVAPRGNQLVTSSRE